MSNNIAPDVCGWHVRLLDQWTLSRGCEVSHPPLRSQRLIAFLALHGTRLRTVVAGTLWPDSNESQALSSLRATIGQTRAFAPGLLGHTRDPLSLDESTTVDVNHVLSAAHSSAASAEVAAHELLAVGELLPGWYDDWVLLEREHLRQVRIGSLDHIAMILMERDLGLALEVAQASVALEPLRESTHRTLVRVYLTAGDRVEALRVYQDFRHRSIQEFGLAPGPSFDELVEPLLRERQQRARPRQLSQQRSR